MYNEASSLLPSAYRYETHASMAAIQWWPFALSPKARMSSSASNASSQRPPFTANSNQAITH